MKTHQRRSSTESGTGVADKLIAATAQIIRDDGPGAATSRAIAEGANENLGAITYYFGSKEALVGEALARAAREIIGPVLDVLTTERPPVEKLLAAVQLLASMLEEHRGSLPAYAACLAASTHSEAVGDETGMLATGAAEADEGVVGYVVAPLDRDLLDGVGHVVNGNGEEPFGQFLVRGRAAGGRCYLVGESSER